MEIVYIDSLFLLNFIIDYLLLLAVGKICALPRKRWRMLLGALWGAAYAVLAVLLPRFFAMAAVKLASGAALPLIAFGTGRRAPRAVLVFFAVSAAFGGAVYAACSLGGYSGRAGLYIPVSMRVLILSFALCYALFTLVFRRAGRRGERRIHEVSVTLDGRTARFTALYDTGNELTDPVTGESVLVAEAQALRPLLSGDAVELLTRDPLDSFQALADLPQLRGRLRLLPCGCVTGSGSLLLLFRPDEVRVDGRKSGVSVAVSRAGLSADGLYQALISE